LLHSALRKKIARNIASPPEKFGRLSRDDCYLILKKRLDADKAILVLGADYYFPIEKEDVSRFLKADLTDQIPYSKSYICRNFSIRLLGDFQIPGWNEFAVFAVWGSGHAFNCFIDHRENVWFIEPQTDEIFAPSKKYQPIGLIFG